jgi:TolB-like protein/class 3 adenylate cyclase/Flp pilus assembly protein TadD
MAEARVERRLAAILAADVAGYSRLMGVDEEGTLAALKAYRRELIDPKISEHRGRIVKSTGDGALVEFASAVDAVRCAMEIQRAMAERNADVPEDRRIEFRIGINVGDIIIDEGDIYGDGVNIAARVETLASPGAICLSDNAYQQMKGKLALDVSDMGEQQLKNIAQPMRVYIIRLDGAPARPVLTLPDKPSIAVLPFANMSGDPEQEYFADGISEDIITAVSKLRWFFVIARNSSFVYKGRAVDVKHVGRDLGVRYVLEGSVRKSGKRVRITAQLIDASTGNHIWSDRYDGELTDVFALQDKITNSVAAAIEPRLLEAEGVRSQNRSPSDIRAWDMAMQANFLFWRLTKADGEAAISILRRTIERYPDYAPAHSMLAFMLLLLGYLGFIAPQVKQAAVLATRAAELDNSDPWAHVALGYVAFTERRTDESVAQFQRALDLNPNFAAAHGYLGWTLAFDGQSDRAIAHSEAAIRMSPHDPQDVIFYGGMAAAHYLAGRYDEAINNALRLLQHRPTFTGALRLRVAALAQAGRLDEARAALERLKELQPDLSIAWIEKNVPYTPAPMAKFLEGWRKVGLQ